MSRVPFLGILGVVVIAGVMLAWPQSGTQPKGPESLQSSARARAVLEAGIAALGGLDSLRAARTVVVRWEGETFERNQGFRPAPPYDKTPNNGMLVMDLRGGQAMHQYEGGYTGGWYWHRRMILKGREAIAVSLTDKSYTVSEAPAGPGGPRAPTTPLVQLPQQYAFPTQALLRQRLPHYMLLHAFDRAPALRWLAESAYQGRPHQLIAFTMDDGTQITAYFDARTHLLTKFESLYVDPVVGDDTQEIIFSGYRTEAAAKLPTGRIVKRAGEVVEDVRYVEVALKTEPPESSLFAAPDGFEKRAPITATLPPDGTVIKLAEDVYLVRAARQNLLFVAFNDYILALEPYEGDGPARLQIAKIKETVPGRPIRYVAVTHHHDDHSGAIRAFIAEGATIVTTPQNRSHFERVASGRFTLAPDSLSERPRKPVFEIIQTKRVFTDGSHTVELYNIGPSPHAEEMVVAYLPKERILYQGDLHNRPADGSLLGTANETTVQFADWIAKSGLQVDSIVGVHGPPKPATMQQLQEAVAMFRASK